MIKKLLHHPLSHFLIILSLGTLTYSNCFGVPFVLDDLESISRNESIRALDNFLPGGTGHDFLPRRWVGYFTFALNYQLGGLEVAGYHLFNLAVHLCTALLVYVLLRQSFRTPFLEVSRLAPQAATLALLAALFFVVHPIQTQAVTYIVQRLASLCTLFYLLSLVLYLAARFNFDASWQEDRGTSARSVGKWLAPLMLTGSVAFALLAMHTKEIAFTLPLVALLFEICFFRGPPPRRLLVLVPLLLTLTVIPFSILGGEELSQAGTLLQTRVDIPRSDYLLTQSRVIVTYLRLLALPVAQNIDYDYPVYNSFFTPPVFLSFLLLAAIAVLTAYLFLRSRLIASTGQRTCDPAVRLIACGATWFFLTLAVESSFMPLADVIFEHRLYLPSVGLFTAFTVILFFAAKRLSGRFSRFVFPAVILLVAALSVATWQRNQVWQSEVSLWADATRKSPGKARAWYNLGTHLTDSGKPEEAIPALMQAVVLDPEAAEAWHNLGRAYLMTDQVSKALVALQTAVRIEPGMDNATVNLAIAQNRAGMFKQAASLLERNIYRFPNWPEARFNLGYAYLGSGKLPAASLEMAVLSRLSPALARELAEAINRAANSPRQ